MKRIEPFEDDKARFDKTRRQYILKKNYPLNELFLEDDVEEELKTNKRMEKLFIEVSDDVYRFIYRHSRRQDLETKQKMLEEIPELREILLKAMLYQLRYYLRSAGGAIKDQHGVDFERSRAIALDRIRGEGTMSPQAIDILYEGAYILNTGKLPQGYYDKF